MCLRTKDWKISTCALRFILFVVSIAICTGIREAQYNNIYDGNNDLPINSDDPTIKVKRSKENDLEIPELIDENQLRELNKLLGNLEINNDRISEIELEIKDDNLEIELEIKNDDEKEQSSSENEAEIAKIEKTNLIRESKHPKQLAPLEAISAQDDINKNDTLLSMLNLDVLGGTLELDDSGNDEENIPNLHVVTLMDTPVADLGGSAKVSKTSNTLEATAELQASYPVQNALAELQASNIIKQAIAELQSSDPIQNALKELQKSQVIQLVMTELKGLNAVKKRLEEGLSSVHMIMEEASKSVQKAMAGDQEAFQKALAGMQNEDLEGVQKAMVEDQEAVQKALAGMQNEDLEGVQKAMVEDQEDVQKALAGLQDEDLEDLSGVQETISKIQTDNEFQEVLEELMALNDIENAIVDVQDSAGAEELNDLE